MQSGPLTPQGFGEQKRPVSRIVQTGWMELIELQVCDTTARPPSERDAVTRSPIWITGIAVDFTRTACGKRHGPCTDRLYSARTGVQDIGACHRIATGD